IRSIAISRDGQFTASASHDTTVKLWDATGSHRQIGPALRHDHHVVCLAFSPDEKYIASGGSLDGNKVSIWNSPNSPQYLETLTGHKESVLSIAFLPESECLVSASWDGAVRVWSLADGREIGKTIECGSAVRAIAASEDGRFLASGGRDGRVIIWDTESHEKVVEMKNPGWSLGVVCSLSFSPDSQRIVSGSEDESVIVWCTKTGDRLAGPFMGHSGWVYSVAFSPNGVQVASCDGHNIHIWHSHTAERTIPPITAPGFGAISLVWTPDGKQIVTGCYLSIRIFDSATGSQVAEWDAHTNFIRSLALSRHGQYLVTGSDKTVKVWDALSHHQIGHSLQHTSDSDNGVRCVAISPDSRYIASAGDDKEMYVWSLQNIVDPSSATDKVHDSVSK
ncbi:hypothetical protein HYDPIDRAFT_86046, partial [Hydnomerulius pinastri MD-312]